VCWFEGAWDEPLIADYLPIEGLYVCPFPRLTGPAPFSVDLWVLAGTGKRRGLTPVG